jgi:hypothetical protein
MQSNRIVRAWSCVFTAAIVVGVSLPGCDSSQSSGPVENAPKQSPVLDQSKDSMKSFFEAKKPTSKK